MRPIVTDVTRSVVCLSLCWSHRCIVQTWLNWTDRDAVWGLTHVGLVIHVLDAGVKLLDYQITFDT